jgi:hypothetical protein
MLPLWLAVALWGASIIAIPRFPSPLPKTPLFSRRCRFERRSTCGEIDTYTITCHHHFGCDRVACSVA